MDSSRKASFNSNPQGSRLRGRKKTGGGIRYRQIKIIAKLKTGKIGKQQS
jgi:hypothetical protein